MQYKSKRAVTEIDIPGRLTEALLEFTASSLVTQMVKNMPAMQETWFLSWDWEDLLEKQMAIHSSILAW